MMKEFFRRKPRIYKEIKNLTINHTSIFFNYSIRVKIDGMDMKLSGSVTLFQIEIIMIHASYTPLFSFLLWVTYNCSFCTRGIFKDRKKILSLISTTFESHPISATYDINHTSDGME